MQFSSDDNNLTTRQCWVETKTAETLMVATTDLWFISMPLMKVHPLGNISVCTQCHNNTSKSCWDASVWTTVEDRPTLTSHFSNYRCDFHVSRLPLTNIILRHGKFFNLDVNRAFWDLNHLHVAWKTRTEIFKVLLLPLSPLCQISFLQDVFFFFFSTQRRQKVIHHVR